MTDGQDAGAERAPERTNAELAERLRHAAETAANDDYSKPMTIMRFRRTARVEAMLAAADRLDDLSRAPALAEECERLKAELATAREKFTMHTAAVHAWFSALLQELGIATVGDKIDVQTACSQVMDKVAALKIALCEIARWRDRMYSDSDMERIAIAALSSTPAGKTEDER